jgi:hypothetical protein
MPHAWCAPGQSNEDRPEKQRVRPEFSPTRKKTAQKLMQSAPTVTKRNSGSGGRRSKSQLVRCVPGHLRRSQSSVSTRNDENRCSETCKPPRRAVRAARNHVPFMCLQQASDPFACSAHACARPLSSWVIGPGRVRAPRQSDTEPSLMMMSKHKPSDLLQPRHEQHQLRPREHTRERKGTLKKRAAKQVVVVVCSFDTHRRRA